jgi:hypothetical protein
MALIEVDLYATLSLIIYEHTANGEAARFLLRLSLSRIMRQCCLVRNCQRFGGISCLHSRDVVYFSRYQYFGGISSLPSSLQKSGVSHRSL